MGKTRRQIAREKAIISVYQNLLVDSSLDEIDLFLSQSRTLKENEDAREFCYWLIKTTIQNKDSYIELLSKYLKKGWTFERLGNTEKAILLIATCELLESETPKSIVINEAVINAKSFCDDNAYKYINGILTQIG